ncbi:MAG: putative polymerase subfamily sigma factor [Ilumatobacteraceae bacterium]|nr:putative polymerase subfamily sigma factor [Ilumatobacteraceae bacterium]
MRVHRVHDDAAVTDVDPVVVFQTFDAFYRDHYQRVLAVSIAVVGDRDRAVDVAQDAFISLQHRWSTVSRYDRPDLWVRRAAINRALSWRRRVGSELRALTRLAARPATASGTDQPDDEVWRFVRELPRAQASVIALVFVGDLTLEAAAQAMGIATSTAKTHLQRAKRTLATRLQEDHDDDR